MGVSFGAEAALHVGALDQRVCAVAAFAPSSVTWAGVRADGSQTSHWSLDGRALPFVPFVEDWEPDTEPPAFKGLYAASMAADPSAVEAAAIPVERIRSVVVAAGGDDRVWDSVMFADRIRARRAAAGLDTIVVSQADAGHRIILPGESVAAGGMQMARGGSPEADAALGAQVWPHLSRLLNLAGHS